MHRLGVRHIQVQTYRLVGVRLGLRQRGPPERRSDGLLLWDAVRGADFGSPERPLRAKARARPDDPAALSFRVRFIRIKDLFLGSMAIANVFICAGLRQVLRPPTRPFSPLDSSALSAPLVRRAP